MEKNIVTREKEKKITENLGTMTQTYSLWCLHQSKCGNLIWYTTCIILLLVF